METKTDITQDAFIKLLLAREFDIKTIDIYFKLVEKTMDKYDLTSKEATVKLGEAFIQINKILDEIKGTKQKNG